MKSTVTTKTVEKVIKEEQKVITLEMTERQAEILYHFMWRVKIDDFVKSQGKGLNLDINMSSSNPDAINFHIYNALAPHFDKYHRDYKPWFYK